MTPTRCRLAAGALAAILANAVPAAKAGDFATLNPLGFSADGHVFAFEQYGVLDGSGFPYSEIFVIDLDADRFVAPSPIRVRLETEGARVEDARAAARSRAAGLFEQHGVGLDPGRLVAANPVTELSADPRRVRFLPRALEPSPDKPVELVLEQIPLAAADYCADVPDGRFVGFRLIRSGLGEGDVARLIHEDQSIPSFRGCPLEYRIAEIRIRGEASGEMRAVAVIGVRSAGFEGPDLRFIALPVPLGD